jgi:acyl dehydratase
MTTFELVTPPITRTQIVRFAGAAGDFNPMHHDEIFARAAGQPSVFAMGQLTAAILGAAIADWFGGENVTGYEVRFRDKVWPEDRLRLSATGAEMRDGVQRWELAAARDHDGVTVLTGWASVRPPGSNSNESAIRSA